MLSERPRKSAASAPNIGPAKATKGNGNDINLGFKAQAHDDNRCQCGTPAAGNPTSAWAQRVVNHLAPGFVLANGSTPAAMERRHGCLGQLPVDGC